MSMFNKPLFLATTLLVSSFGVTAHAATMSSDVAQSGVLETSTGIPELPIGATSENPGEVKTQASAYLSPVEEKKQGNEKEAIALTSGALVLGSYFLQSSSDGFSPNADSPSVDITSPGLEPVAEVAPVPELSTMSLMLVAMVGMMGAAWMRKKKEGINTTAVRLPIARY